MSTTLYNDGGISCDDHRLVIRRYYPWGAKRIAYTSIKGAAAAYPFKESPNRGRGGSGAGAGATSCSELPCPRQADATFFALDARANTEAGRSPEVRLRGVGVSGGFRVERAKGLLAR